MKHYNWAKLSLLAGIRCRACICIAHHCLLPTKEANCWKTEARRERPIEDFADELQACTMTTEMYGLTFNRIDTPESVSSKRSSDSGNVVPLHLKSCTYTNFFQRLLPQYPVPEHTTSDAIYRYNRKWWRPSGWYCTHISTEIHFKLKSLSWMFMHRCIAHCSDTTRLQLHNVPFMNTVLADLAPDELEDHHAEEHKRLHNILASWNFTLIPVTGDGNCLFSSIAFNLLQWFESSHQCNCCSN